MKSKKVIFLMGPTAVGKSGVAAELADQFHGRVVNADSLQFFKDLNIGTAKPTVAERASVPHELFDLIDLGGEFNAAEFYRRANKLIESTEDPLFFVGGSGFYFRALENGMFEVPLVSVEVNDKFNREFAAKGPQAMHEELGRLDPVSAQRIHPNDKYRIFRALTLMEASGQKLSEIQAAFDRNKKQNSSFQILKVGLTRDREELRGRIQGRVKVMMSNGWVDEVKDLLNRGLEDWPPLRSIGYKEISAALRDGSALDASLEELIYIRTCQYSKRQMTWLRGEDDIQLFKLDEQREAVTQSVADFLRGKEGL